MFKHQLHARNILQAPEGSRAGDVVCTLVCSESNLLKVKMTDHLASISIVAVVDVPSPFFLPLPSSSSSEGARFSFSLCLPLPMVSVGGCVIY